MTRYFKFCFAFSLFVLNISNSTSTFGPPSTWDRSCPIPSSSQCLSHPGAKFPSLDINFYYICGESGQVATVRCFCETVFDMRQQTCVRPEELNTIGCSPYDNYHVRLCDDDDECVRYFFDNFDKMFGSKMEITKEDIYMYLRHKNQIKIF